MLKTTEEQRAQLETAIDNLGVSLGVKQSLLTIESEIREAYTERIATLSHALTEQTAALVEVAAELRHAYMNLTNANNSTDATRRLADGLIAPQIRKLETLGAGK
jgi:uncharacterized coiled-coil protein SlyX